MANQNWTNPDENHCMYAALKNRAAQFAVVLCTGSLFVHSDANAQDFWQQTNGPYYGGAIQYLAFNANGDVFAGTERGGVFRSEDKGDTWTQVSDGLSSDVRCLVINKSGHVFAGTYGFGVFRSIDNGNTWTRINNGLTNTFVLSLVINADEYIFACADGEVYRSLDNGGSWEKVFAGMGVTTLAIHPNGDVFAGTARLGIFRSPNNGQNWIQPNFITNEKVHALAINSQGYVFASTFGGFFISKDNGDNWTRIYTAPAPGALAINAEDEIFAGVRVSRDNGNNWAEITTGLTDRSVLCLAIDSLGYIYAGTQYGGVFRSLLPTTPVKEIAHKTPTSFSLEQNYPNPFNSGTTIQFSLPRSGYVTLKVYNTLGAEVATLVAENLSAGKHQVEWNANDLPGGVYFYRLQQPGGAVQTKKLIVTR